MLLEDHPEYVGVTIHHISAGIDSGDIILSDRPELDVNDNFEMIHAKVFHLGVTLFVKAVNQLIDGSAEKVAQWEHGKLFLKRTGYLYSPYLRVKVNKKIKDGLIQNYLKDREPIDEKIILVGAGL